LYTRAVSTSLPVRNFRPQHVAWQQLTKVPKITAFFWIIKILTTGMGEATSDWLDHRYNPYLAGTIGLLVFVVALVIQFRTDRYRPWAYWFAVAMVAVFGTMAADGLHVELGVPYLISTLFYAVSLVVIFSAWYKSEKTLSIHSVYTPRREAFYWLAVLATFAMGTALGDLTAYSIGLGYFTSGVMFAVIFALPGLGRWLFKLNPIFSFWFAYIITRPLGASFADWLGTPKSLGGLDWGRGLVSLSLTALIIVCVGFVSLARQDAPSRRS
jgi:uncharacterized membrane-anchored protein